MKWKNIIDVDDDDDLILYFITSKINLSFDFTNI